MATSLSGDDAINSSFTASASFSSFVLWTIIRFLTNDWGEKISRIILKDEKTIVCPICIPTGECSFKGRMYGGSLECLSVRPGVGVVLESRWNTSPKQGDAVECVMGGAYAFDAGWHRKTGGYGGIKGCCQTELVSISLRTRLAGGRCVVADVEMEHEFRSSPQFRVTPSQSAYNKIRLASVVFPPEVFAAVPALLRGSVGLEEGLKSFIEDFKASVDDRDSFWHLCGGDPWESAKRAGIAFGIDFKARKTVG